MTEAPAPQAVTARALLLGERIDARLVPRLDGVPLDTTRLGQPADLIAIAFRWGAIVLVGATAEQERTLCQNLRAEVGGALATPVDETLTLLIGAAEDGVTPAGTVTLRDASPARLQLVADVLAKSAALSHQEATLAQTLDGIEPVVAGLRLRGRLALSPRRLLAAIGTALHARSRTAARVQADSKPDLLWDHPELERLHARLVDELELRERIEVLDRKLVLIGETTQTLIGLIDARRSMVLETAIVLFVGIELLTTLYGLIAG